MTGPDENVTAPAAPAKWRAPLPPSQDEPGEGGPGLPGWQPLPEADDVPAPPTDDLLIAIQGEISTTLDQCEQLLRGLEHRVGLALYEQARRRIATERTA